MSARFLISILTYRLESGVAKCIESVLRGGGAPDFHLTSNGCREFVAWASQHDALQMAYLVPHSENLGFIQPNNRAMDYAQANGYDYLVTLNDDATVPPGWLAAIEAEFERHPSAAIVGAQGACRTLSEDYHGYNGTALEFIEGSCACYKVAVWKKHFKTLYPSGLSFAYGEDSSASLEVRRLGYTIHQANFTIEHNRGTTSKHVPEAKISQKANHEWALSRYAHYLKFRTFAHRIIVKRKYSAGDVLLVTPVIRELWRTNPLCKIFVETNFPELFAGNPCVEHACVQMDRQATDLVINLDMVSENGPMRHFVTSYARAAGVEVELPCKLEIYWRLDSFAGFAKGYYRWIAVHAGSSTWPAKELKAAKWNELLARLKAADWQIMLVGNGVLPGIDMRFVDSDMRLKTKTLNDLAALLSHADAFLGLDSFPLHCAQAVGIPAVGLFGITCSRYILTAPNAIGVNADAAVWPRAGERHRVAGQTMIHEDGATLNSLTVEQVLAAVEQVTKQLIIA